MKKLLLITIIVFCLGCKSKKKATERSDVKIEQMIENKNNASNFKETTSDENTEIKTKTSINDKVETIEAVSLDSTDRVSVNKIVKGDSTEWKFKGVKTFKIKFSETSIKTSDSNSVNKRIQEVKKDTLSNELKIDNSMKQKKRTSKVESKGLSFWIYVYIGIAVLIIALYFVYKYRPSLFNVFRKVFR